MDAADRGRGGSSAGRATPALADPAARPVPPILTGREMLVLQLLARRYSRDQIVALTGRLVAAVQDVEQSACAALGVAAVEEAVELARHRRLII